MGGLWTSLLPLIIGSALVPIQIVITPMLLRGGRASAVAWVAGMTVVRLGQGILFGLLLGGPGTGGGATGSTGAGTGVSLLLLVLAIVFYVTAAKQVVAQPDEDAPPPRWMAMIDSVTPVKAFGLGAGLVLVGVKFWVFTLGAIAAIGDAALGSGGAIATYLLFVVLAESIHLVIIGLAFVAPRAPSRCWRRWTRCSPATTARW